MRRALVIPLVLLLATTALAGCAMPGGEDEETEPTPDVVTTPTPTPDVTPTTPSVTPTPVVTPTPSLDSSSYQLAAVGAPALAKPGQVWNATLFVNGSQTRTSDHIGAHYADNDTFAPNASAMQACEHQGGALPGSFVVGCTIATEGTWFVWGHARLNDAGTVRNWWTSQPFIVKVVDYNLTASGFPSNAQASNSSFTFQVDIKGKQNLTSDHIGAHYWNATEANPTVQNSAGACAHITAGMIANHTITCSIPNSGLTPKDYFIRGHARLTESGSRVEWWSAETKVSILGGLPVSPI